MLSELRRLLARARVSESGAILLGDHVAVDGHEPGRPVRVVTHIHYDHIRDLERSIRETSLIAATPITLDLLSAMGKPVPTYKSLPLEPGKPVEVEDCKLQFLHANHVPGSVQVLLELRDGTRVGYTGDFKLPGTPVMRDLDVLVIDATYGFEEWVRPWQEEIEYLLVDIVNDSLARGPVYIYGYYGKIQEVMLLLRKHGVDAPYVAPPKMYRMAQVLRKYGYHVGEVHPANSRSAAEVMRSGWYIYFEHMNRRGKGSARGASWILLTGWEFREPYRRVSSNGWVVSFSDHADFKQLREYVEEAKPRLLVVDRFRGGQAAERFAAYARRRLGIPAVALP